MVWSGFVLSVCHQMCGVLTNMPFSSRSRCFCSKVGLPFPCTSSSDLNLSLSQLGYYKDQQRIPNVEQNAEHLMWIYFHASGVKIMKYEVNGSSVLFLAVTIAVGVWMDHVHIEAINQVFKTFVTLIFFSISMNSLMAFKP